ncbi:DNA gyrase inhibitor YacG [Stakelama sediminis]|uniref:DNA gyrase inhibitor YacG n=1 Tax=Stakelama sediminis TaxID=463200 RepID=A0A840YXG1_9SPHN|nr:DNA gyrase inhibitor YacG [Stakelama sediminis]MBB5718232.1 hypothetical protein [Stakelama sediminis]
MSRPVSREKCPLCGDPAVADHAPFCSRACRDRDLLNWLGEGYRLPGTTADAQSHLNRESGLDSDDLPD